MLIAQDDACIMTNNDMLDEFEKEYQAFIEKLKQQRAEKLR